MTSSPKPSLDERGWSLLSVIFFVLLVLSLILRWSTVPHLTSDPLVLFLLMQVCESRRKIARLQRLLNVPDA